MTYIRRIVLSGCSGGGKSTLLKALAARGHTVFEEAGRETVEREIKTGGRGVPWLDMGLFAHKALDLSIARYHQAKPGLSFYDRSFLDILAWAERSNFQLADIQQTATSGLHYDQTVFLVPPWPAIYEHDEARKHDLKDALVEYEHLLEYLPAQGYTIQIIPKIPVEDRADWIEARVLAVKGE